ncbi:MAG: hypothetical protein R3Y08_08205 [Rikenellaceae bacterium]
MNREYNQAAFDALDSVRARRIENEVEIHTNNDIQPIEEPSEQSSIESSKIEIEDEDQVEQPTPTAEEIAQQEEERLREEKRKAREKSIIWQFISGNWMILEGVTGTYRYLLIIAATLFMSVVSIFITFHLSEKLTNSANSAQLLRERSLEYQRIRFNKTSHSAIVKELEHRGIPLYDIHESKTIIE